MDARNSHGLHSPFAYDFYQKVVLAARKAQPAFDQVRSEISNLKKDRNPLSFHDPSTGISVNTTVGRIAAGSAKNHHLGKILGLAMNYLKPENALELGTSLGISAAYQQILFKPSRFHTIEANELLTPFSSKLWERLNIQATLKVGYFDSFLPEILQQQQYQWVFIDGNHQLEPTLRYFKYVLENTPNNCVIIFDDINWSSDMQKAWSEIVSSEYVTLCLDLFFLGFVFRDPALSKETFKLRL